MWYIKPTVSKQDIICAEIPAKPAGIAAFGASGDLVQRKLVPGLFELHKRGLLSENFFFLGCGRKNYTDDDFRQIISKSIKKISSYKDKTWNFINKFYFVSGGYDDPVFYEKLNTRISELNSQYNTQQNIIFYLAVPPHLYTTIVEKLGQQKLSCPQDNASKENVKLVVEKPFGRDLQTAIELDDRIHNCFDEKQIYRIDHYLGKETVQNILVLRFANSIFEPLWNRNFIDHIQITAAESIGIGHRGGYYDNAGALRDMFQNHMLQMLALAAMEPPTSFDADRIRDEKVKLLRSIRPFDIDQLDKFIVKGQYTKATINNHSIPDYRSQNNVDPESTTETFVAAKLFIDNWRWKGVPFYLRTAKALKAKDTEIAITFKQIPHSLYASSGFETMPPNVLVLQIQPEEGTSLSFQAKRPGSKLCMGTINMDFKYSSLIDTLMPDSYQRLLLDCMLSDQTLFTRHDAVKVSWNLITPVLEKWRKDKSAPHPYPAGSESFPAADNLIESDGRKWRKLSRT